MNIGSNIKNFRIFRGLKQQDIAEELGRTKSVISNWERGENSPDVESCEKLCKLLQVTPNELFGWEENRDYVRYKAQLRAYYDRLSELRAHRDQLNEEINKLNCSLAEKERLFEDDKQEE